MRHLFKSFDYIVLHHSVKRRIFKMFISLEVLLCFRLYLTTAYARKPTTSSYQPLCYGAAASVS